MELREHIGAPVKNHRVIEGGCYHDGVYYLMFGNMTQETTVIVKLLHGKEKKVLGASKPLKVGHANDCCVRGDTIYITHSGRSNAIHRVSATTLKKLSDVTITGCKGGFNGISCMGKGYIVKKMSSKKCYILDKDFKYKSTMTLSKTRKVGQGMTWVDGKLYRGASQGQSKENWVSIYNSKGKCIKEYQYKHECELEDVFVFGETIKCSVYKKYTKKGKKHFEAYIRTVHEG